MHALAEAGLDPGAKGGRPPVRRKMSASGPWSLSAGSHPITVWGWRRLGMASGARADTCGTLALRDLVKGERAFAGASMGRIHRQAAQVLWCLIPARPINT
jgi:hypothetical protein